MRNNPLTTLRPFLVFFVLSLLVLTGSRLGLVLWQSERVAATGGFGYVFLQGLRFDIILLCMLLLIPATLTPVVALSRRVARFWYPGVYLYLTLGFASIVMLELTTPGFILQYDTRPNRVFFEYLAYPKEVGAMLLTGYKLQIAIVVAGTLGAGLIMRHTLSRGHARVMARPYPWFTLLLVPLLAVTLAVGIRSSTAHRPANPSTVAFSSDAMINTLPLNSLYQVLYAAYETLREDDTRFVYGRMDEVEAVRVVRQDLAPLDPQFPDAEIPTLHHQEASVKREHPLNLVIVLEESLGAEFVGVLGGLPLTPNLDRLAAEGLWFDNLYATGTRSVRGIEAVVTGFTPTPARAVVKLSRSQRNFFTLAALLARQGYHTSFIYGGESHFDNMGRFFTGNGFDRIIDERDYASPAFRGSWGVSDEDLFERAHQVLQAESDRPFFSLIFTSSNHDPFEYPPGRIEPYDPQPATVNNAVKYADYALGRFIERARQSAYWDDTLFLIVADHNARVYGADLVPVERFHIPALILGADVEPQHIDTVASQIDLAPTLLSLMGISSDHPMIGRDLTRPELRQLPGRAIMQYNTTQAYLQGDQLLVMQPDQPPHQFVYEHAHLTPAPLDPELARIALAHQVWGATMYREGGYHLP